MTDCEPRELLDLAKWNKISGEDVGIVETVLDNIFSL